MAEPDEEPLGSEEDWNIRTSSESSWELELIRSVGSSFSVTDESECEETQLLRDQLAQFEAALYNDGPTEQLLPEAREEARLWATFPHLRVVGRRISVRCREPVDDSDAESDSSTVTVGSQDDEETLKDIELSDSEVEGHGLLSPPHFISRSSAGRKNYPLQVQTVGDMDGGRLVRLSPLPQSVHTTYPRSARGPPRTQTPFNPPETGIHCEELSLPGIRYGTLPPIENLDISPKPLLSRSTSARLVPVLSRPATSKPTRVVLRPICGRNQTTKIMPLSPSFSRDNRAAIHNDLKPVKHLKRPPMLWKY